jgi:hypothetical protein
MRSEESTGGVQIGTAQLATVNLVEMAGTSASIEVPLGCVAIVTACGYIIPASDTVRSGVLVDGQIVGQQWFVSAAVSFTSIAEVGSGCHQIAVGIQAPAPAGGKIQLPSISWVIVRRGSR